ncbi:MAG: hypothetical protein IJD22_03540 [Clostridia bacterium]|nr:hypothetical protein [Clostridia bacterium]
MEKYYIVARIEGEYAYLRELDSEDEVFIAMALLPPGTDVGTKLKNEFFSYEIVE